MRASLNRSSDLSTLGRMWYALCWGRYRVGTRPSALRARFRVDLLQASVRLGRSHRVAAPTGVRKPHRNSNDRPPTRLIERPECCTESSHLFLLIAYRSHEINLQLHAQPAHASRGQMAKSTKQKWLRLPPVVRSAGSHTSIQGVDPDCGPLIVASPSSVAEEPDRMRRTRDTNTCVRPSQR